MNTSIKMKNAISWFEIGTVDLSRAQSFYEKIFNIELQAFDLPNIKMRLFPIENPNSGVGGALVDSGGFHQPSKSEGPLIYLNANPDVQQVLDRVVQAGGSILVPKTPISDEFGHMAVIIDTEGNRIALHSIP
jgi:predicted enzyme related to lactoylglutathione lyase